MSAAEALIKSTYNPTEFCTESMIISVKDHQLLLRMGEGLKSVSVDYENNVIIATTNWSWYR